ncbi:HAMP domain-containing histidine kinase [Vibrio sp. 404]|uniref:histidine kinase n=1 Tax=Vibrio marinisediminis TaxID=2758441 RepID=A0A7W2FRW4_9VIBR|nr:HAMP domain-containing sensor histidine kinase [Vibrio marinisediminis]MBA5763082.1 HAMP domain-containing histidine kinase [Vibrio marinisediminis]
MLSLLVASLPLAVTVFVYDRMTAGLVSEMATERAQQNLLQIKNSIYHFSRQHIHALEAISELPEIPRLFQTQNSLAYSSQTLSLIHFDIDRPEIYGALFFDPNWRLVNALPGQSASGYPYWGQGSFDISALAKAPFGTAMLIGPTPAVPGHSAWYLMALPVYQAENEKQPLGYVAFQLRLASLTQYLSNAHSNNTLLCPSFNQSCFDVLARTTSTPSNVGETQTLLGDWHLVNITQETPLLARGQERLLVLLMAVLVLCLVSMFFYFLVKRVRRRVFPLIDAANAVSVGDWSTRLPVQGNDEISLLARSFNRMTGHLDSLLLARGEAERKAVWGEFATGIAHEIRNPLATIKVCVQSLSEGKAEDRELQQLMVGEIDRINQLISGLLEYARPPDPETQHVPLNNVIKRLACLISPMAKERGIQLQVECDTTLCIEADENQIQQILMNLLLNALDASQPGSEIHLSVELTKEAAMLVVSDQGCGMDEKQIATISQPFYTTKTTGTGLGLSVSQRLAEMNNARLEFHSQPRKGTQAVLRFEREFLCEPSS